MEIRKKQRYPVLAAAVISLMLSITACATSPKIEYVYETYDVAFPLFPDPEPVVFDDTTETVSMPLWYWQKIAEYKIEVDAIQSYFEKIQRLQK